MLTPERQRRIRNCMIEVTAGIRLQRNIAEFPQFAECFRAARGKTGWRLATQIGAEQAKAAFISRRRRLEARARKCCCGNAANARPAGMNALGPGTIFKKLKRPRRHGKNDTLRCRHLRRRCARKPPGGERCAKGANHACRVKAKLVKGTLRCSTNT